MNDEPVLVLQSVTVRLGGRIAIERVDLTVGRRDLVALVGPNGAGKTTVLRAVLGLVPLEDGAVSVDGLPARRARAAIGYVPQHHAFAWDFPISVAGVVMTGRTRAIGWFRRPAAPDREAVEEALARVGMVELRARPIGELSGGQRQRVLVARALALRPAVLLLDEPFSGVDLPTQEALSELLDGLVAEGRAVLMTTHDLAAAAETATRLCLLNRTVIGEGSPSELRDPALWLETFGVARSRQLLFALGVSE